MSELMRHRHATGRLRFISSFILLGFLFVQSSFGAGSSEHSDKTIELCVLNFEREQHPFTGIIKGLFQQREDTLLVNEAKPIDILNCLERNPREIILVLHSLQMDSEGLRWRWGYVTRVEGQAREQRIAMYLQQAEAHLQHLLDSPQRTTRIKRINKTRRRVPTRYGRELEQTKKALEYIQNVPDERVIYDFKPMLSRIFELSKKHLQESYENSELSRLESLRVVSCESERVLETYNPLVELIEDNQVNVDFGPEQKIMTWIKGRQVSTLDQLWLAESAQDVWEMDPGEHVFMYMNLKTRGLSRRGQRVGLRGQFEFRLRGAALGLGQKESMVFVKAAHLQGLQVGETKSIRTPHLGVSAALWPNIEFTLAPKPHVQLPSEINSLGIALGLWSTIEVTRLY